MNLCSCSLVCVRIYESAHRSDECNDAANDIKISVALLFFSSLIWVECGGITEWFLHIRSLGFFAYNPPPHPLLPTPLFSNVALYHRPTCQIFWTEKVLDKRILLICTSISNIMYRKWEMDTNLIQQHLNQAYRSSTGQHFFFFASELSVIVHFRPTWAYRKMERKKERGKIGRAHI